MSARKVTYMATYENDSYTSKGVGNAGLTLGIIGTTLASGILGGGNLGGIFGNNGNPTASAAYQLSSKDTEIAQLKAERYADGEVKALSKEVCDLRARVSAIEVAEPLREQILVQQINCVANTVNKLVQPMIPNGNVAPGWGPAFVSPFPPPVPAVQNGGTVTSTSTSTNG